MAIEICNIVNVDAAWPTVAPMLARCMEKTGDDLSTGELWQMCRSGNAFLILEGTPERIRMASVWQFQKWANGSVFRCIALAGEEMAEWLPELTPFIEKIMREGGATRLVFEGREWAAHFRKLGRDARKLRSTFTVEL